MTALMRDLLRMMTGNTLPVITGRTASVAVNYPIIGEMGLVHPVTGMKLAGSPLGTCGKNGSGGLFLYCSREVFKAGLTRDSNSIKFGLVGEGKSAEEKLEIIGDVERGLRTMVTDLKDEYSLLASKIPGARVLRMGDKSVSINALDNSIPRDMQLLMIEALVLSAMTGRKAKLSPTDKVALQRAHAAAHSGRSQALLVHLKEAMTNPTPEVICEIANLPLSEKDSQYAKRLYADLTRELTHALSLLTKGGSLSGNFDEPTTPGLLDPTPLLVLSLKDLPAEKWPSTLVVFNFFIGSKLQSGVKSSKMMPFHTIRHDEAWKLVGDPGFLASTIELYKIGNSLGVSNRITAHQPANLFAQADSEAIETLLGDATTRVLFKLGKKAAESSQALLGLTDHEVERVQQLEPLQSMFKVGDLTGITVNHRPALNHSKIRPIVETRNELRQS